MIKIVTFPGIIFILCLLGCKKDNTQHVPPTVGHCVITEILDNGSIYTLKGNVTYAFKDTLYGQPTYEMGGYLTGPANDTIFTKIQLSNIIAKQTFGSTTIAATQQGDPNCYFTYGTRLDTFTSYPTPTNNFPNSAIMGTVSITSFSSTYILGTFQTFMADYKNNYTTIYNGTFEGTFPQ